MSANTTQSPAAGSIGKDIEFKEALSAVVRAASYMGMGSRSQEIQTERLAALLNGRIAEAEAKGREQGNKIGWADGRNWGIKTALNTASTQGEQTNGHYRSACRDVVAALHALLESAPQPASEQPVVLPNCETCNGNGTVGHPPDDYGYQCPNCKGTGFAAQSELPKPWAFLSKSRTVAFGVSFMQTSNPEWLADDPNWTAIYTAHQLVSYARAAVELNKKGGMK